MRISKVRKQAAIVVELVFYNPYCNEFRITKQSKRASVFRKFALEYLMTELGFTQIGEL